MAEADNKQETTENKDLNVTQDALPEVPEFRVGDTVRVLYKIYEGKEYRRTQPFEGIVIAKKGSGVSKTFMVRRIGAASVGVERIFPLYSPNIEDIKVLKKGRVRRSKLFYLRDRKGKSATNIKVRKDQ